MKGGTDSMKEASTVRRQSGRISRWITAIVSAALLVALDQITKALAAAKLSNGYINLIPGVFRLEYLENRGAAFGVFQNATGFFIAITVLFLVAAVWFFSVLPDDRKYRPLRIVCVVLAAGAVGNLIDRIFLHYVRDFLYFVLIDFPIFNVADIYVTLSAAALIIMILFVYSDEDFAFLKKK